MTEKTGAPDLSEGRCLYRIEVAGRIDPQRASWLGARIAEPAGERTILEVATDQAGLLGLLRRLHDLHLHLHSVSPIENPED